MQVIITAVGPDNRGLADPIVHFVTSAGANIAGIQMYDHDEERLFAMLLRIDWPAERLPVADLRAHMDAVARQKGLSIRTWSREEMPGPPRLALCVTHRPEAPAAVLHAVRDQCLRPPHADLRRHRSFHCAGTGCRRSDHPSRHLHGGSRNTAGRDSTPG